MDQLLQHIANALILGGTYALLGIGLTLILGIMKVVNFTHGELYSFGGFMAYFFVSALGWNFFLAMAVSIMLGILLGACIERVFLRRMRNADIDSTMIVMIGCWIALQNIALLIWGGVAKIGPNPLFYRTVDHRPHLHLVATCFFCPWRSNDPDSCNLSPD
ncbi:branched-chain amino acid ABC transporter permease [Undibacterium arcticum]